MARKTIGSRRDVFKEKESLFQRAKSICGRVSRNSYTQKLGIPVSASAAAGGIYYGVTGAAYGTALLFSASLGAFSLSSLDFFSITSKKQIPSLCAAALALLVLTGSGYSYWQQANSTQIEDSLKQEAVRGILFDKKQEAQATKTIPDKVFGGIKTLEGKATFFGFIEGKDGAEYTLVKVGGELVLYKKGKSESNEEIWTPLLKGYQPSVPPVVKKEADQAPAP